MAGPSFSVHPARQDERVSLPVQRPPAGIAVATLCHSPFLRRDFSAAKDASFPRAPNHARQRYFIAHVDYASGSVLACAGTRPGLIRLPCSGWDLKLKNSSVFPFETTRVIWSSLRGGPARRRHCIELAIALWLRAHGEKSTIAPALAPSRHSRVRASGAGGSTWKNAVLCREDSTPSAESI